MQKAAHNRTKIAAIIGVHKSTVSREPARNGGGRGYRPKQAHELATARQMAVYRSRIGARTWARAEQLLRQEWSPEQVTDRQLEKVVERLNNRLRKTLGYKTQHEIFFKLPLVALQT